jgi:predicted RecA/RadA family phage recombinase
MRKIYWLLLTVGCLTAASAFAQGTPLSTTTADWFNNSSTLFRDGAGVALSQGVAATNNDGMLVQIGYFSAANAANNFAGVWIPLTGAGASSNTTIGDSPGNTGLGAGRIGFTTTWHFGSSNVEVYDSSMDSGFYNTQSSIAITANPNTSTGAPPQGQVLAIRFYDTNNGAAGSHYNTVSSDTWTWQGPTENGGGANILLNVGTSVLEWESVAVFGLTGTEFRTVILVPEPSSIALIGLGVGLVPLLRRRKA